MLRQGGFAADGSEDLPDLSKHKNIVAEVLSKIPELYDRLKDRLKETECSKERV